MPPRQSLPAIENTRSINSPHPQVAATMTSTGQGRAERPHSPASSALPTASFDLANHPALASSKAPGSMAASARKSPVTPPVPPRYYNERQNYTAQRPETYPRPAYETVDGDIGPRRSGPTDELVRHVVENSDTLEKLAKRYLGDEGRALEIFDLNRDVLDNPHLLPISAELRIPIPVRRDVD